MTVSLQKAAFLGLGVMGFPMAGHLSEKSGLAVTVFNRTVSKAESWCRKYKGQYAATPAESVKDADIVFICVGNDDDLRAILTGPNGVMDTIKTGTIIVDHTTVSAEISREMAALFAKKDVSFLDAPVSGGQAGAEKGQLSVMTGGNPQAFDIAAPIIRQSYAKEIRLIGDTGAGQTAKMINQICIVGVVQGLAEGLAFGQKAGLNMTEVLSVISQGAAQSWQMQNRSETMLASKFDYGFALDWMIKDLEIALAEAARNGASLPNTKTILEYYKELSAQGDGRLDTSALIRRLI